MSLRVAGTAVAAWCVLSGVAAAQEVGTAVADLRDHDVTFEDGALSQDELDRLDATTADLQDADGYFKVVVLAEDVSDYSNAAGYADAVRAELGGRGRVMVYAPTEVALSSNLDPTALVEEAERTAAAALNGGSTLAVATADAATKLSGDISGVAADARDSAKGGGGGGGSAWGLVLLLLAPIVALVGFLWWTARKMRKKATAMSAEEIGAAETKVRTAVDSVANDVLDLSDRVDQPGAPPEAKAAFTQGAELFTTAQEMLESADTRAELEAAYPKVVEAGWQMDTAKALLDGLPAPAQPEPEPLFPRVVTTRPTSPAGVDASGIPVPAGAESGAPAAAGPEPHYRQSGASPWLTAAAMAAISVLSQRGMSVPKTRPSMDEGSFGNWSGGLPPPPSSNRNRGFGFGRRGEQGGRVVTPSRQGSQGGRGMGRRGTGRR